MSLELVGAFAQVVTALAAVIAAVAALRAHAVAREVKEEVKTANGSTLAKLADLAEGRRVQSEVPEENRSASERHYVEGLRADSES